METSTRFRKNFVKRIERNEQRKQAITILASLVLFWMLIPFFQAFAGWLFATPIDANLFT